MMKDTIKLQEEIKEQATKLVARLNEKGKKITFAESCTGGLLSASLTDVSGSSAVFDGSIVSYANRVKKDFLKVEERVLEDFGAVSARCALQMALGARRTFGADIGVSITGIAGPTGGSAEKPVGTVFIGVSHEKSTAIVENHFEGDREQVRLQSVLKALELCNNIEL
ncbi:MAG: CinA family protein [Clostridia bacterium]|nr:CinA family protein [Clostridia bacterium]